MAKKTTSLSIVFSDVAGSTKLYETLGDVKAREIVSSTINDMSQQVERYGGRVIKTIGDEVMSCFNDAESAVNAAVAMQEVVTDNNENNPPGDPRVAIRIGLHFGPAILEKDGDVFGDAVNVAARMAGLAKADQIITSKDTVELLSPALRASTRFTDRAPLKGKQDEMDIFEVIWQQEDVTRMATDVIMTTAPAVKLHLTYDKIEITMDQNRSNIVMGRGATCDITINDTMSSRQHARVEYRRGKFYVIDQSTNGTYVRIDSEPDAFLRREEILLKGSGMFSLGRTFDETPNSIVHYRCET